MCNKLFYPSVYHCNYLFCYQQINIDESPRAWHVAAAYHPYSSSTYCEVVVTGGNKHVRGIAGARNAVSDTIMIEFG